MNANLVAYRRYHSVTCLQRRPTRLLFSTPPRLTDSILYRVWFIDRCHCYYRRAAFCCGSKLSNIQLYLIRHCTDIYQLTMSTIFLYICVPLGGRHMFSNQVGRWTVCVVCLSVCLSIGLFTRVSECILQFVILSKVKDTWYNGQPHHRSAQVWHAL